MLPIIKHRSVQVLLVLAVYFAVARFLPPAVHQGFYTVSLFIKDLLMWLLPLTVAIFISYAIGYFKKEAPLFIITLVIFELLSNFTSVWYAYLGGHLVMGQAPPPQLAPPGADFTALWRLPFVRPAWWSADKGALLGLIFGCIAALGSRPFLQRIVSQGKERAQWVLTKIFSRLIPLYVLGFVARMYQMNFFQTVVVPYSTLLIVLVGLLASYIVALFIIGSDWTLKGILQSIKNLLPAGSLAFTSGCSISTMPWTIEGTAKNLQNPSFAKAVIPATTNIQQIGDCIINAFLCFLIYRHFFGHPPDFATWAAFSIMFALARFGTAAVLGGAIFIMLPIYESYLSFNGEMIAIILAFNVILDPLVTSCNVVANGALCRVYEKVWMKLPRKVRGVSEEG
jgi:hypothetical protein